MLTWFKSIELQVNQPHLPDPNKNYFDKKENHSYKVVRLHVRCTLTRLATI